MTANDPGGLFGAGLLPESVLAFRPRHQSDQIDWQGLLPAAAWLTALLQPRRFVELGSYAGDSYCSFCQSIDELGVDCKAFAVDLWEGDEHTGAYGPEILAKLRDYHDPKYAHFSRLMQMSFDDARDSFDDASIDLLHIDGLHTYEAASHDFRTWLPKMSDRGVVILHDTIPRERGFGVYRLWEEIERDHLCFNLPHSNGLGVVVLNPDAAPEAIVRVARLDEAGRRPIVLALKALGDLVIAHAKARFRAGEAEQLKARVGELTWSIDDLRRGHRSELSELLHLVCAEFPGLSERLAAIEDRLRRLEETGSDEALEAASDPAEFGDANGG